MEEILHLLLPAVVNPLSIGILPMRMPLLPVVVLALLGVLLARVLTVVLVSIVAVLVNIVLKGLSRLVKVNVKGRQASRGFRLLVLEVSRTQGREMAQIHQEDAITKSPLLRLLLEDPIVNLVSISMA